MSLDPTDRLINYILRLTRATSIDSKELLQTPWSGYGEIVRYQLSGASFASVIVKQICFKNKTHHPRGWDTEYSHIRKLRSYEVEQAWYSHWAQRCDNACQVAKCLGADSGGNEITLVLEDLDRSGFSARKSALNRTKTKVCLDWLASFHAQFINDQFRDLWPIGRYWHLATRPDEWQIMADSALKSAASMIDQQLNNCTYQTIIHGDTKVDNFCFTPDMRSVAAVDPFAWTDFERFVSGWMPGHRKLTSLSK